MLLAFLLSSIIRAPVPDSTSSPAEVTVVACQAYGAREHVSTTWWPNSQTAKGRPDDVGPCSVDKTRLSAASPSMQNISACHHRAFCGPLHLLPANRAERRAFVARVAVQMVDGIVTEVGLHQNRLRFPNLLSLAPCPAAATENTCHGPAEQAAISWGRTIGSEHWHLTEADPFVVFAAKNGLGAILAEGVAFDAATARIEHTWSSSNRTQFDITEAAGHVVGIATWLPLFAAVHHYKAAYQACATAVEVRGELIGPGNAPPTQIVVYTPNYPIGVYSSIHEVPLAACQRFSSIPIDDEILTR